MAHSNTNSSSKVSAVADGTGDCCPNEAQGPAPVVPTLDTICRLASPPYVFKSTELSTAFELPPLVKFFKQATHIRQATHPNHPHLPYNVCSYPGLVTQVYDQLQLDFGPQLLEPRGDSMSLSLYCRMRADDPDLGSGAYATETACGLLFGSIPYSICNQLCRIAKDDFKNSFYPGHFPDRPGRLYAGAEKNLVLIAHVAPQAPSTIHELHNWVLQPQRLRYDVNIEDALQVKDSPQLTLQKFIIDMVSGGVTRAMLMDTTHCCFATLMAYEDKSDQQFLVLSKVYDLCTEEIALVGTLVALLLDAADTIKFKIKWPNVEPPPLEPSLSHQASLSASLHQPVHKQSTSGENCVESDLMPATNTSCFVSAHTCSIRLEMDTLSPALPLKLYRISPSEYPCKKYTHWIPRSSSVVAPLPDFVSADLGDEIGHGRSGTVYRLPGTDSIAKIAEYQSSERILTLPLERIHMEAELYETLLAPLQGKVIPRYGGFFSNQPTKFGNCRVLVLEDCGKALSGADFTSFDLNLKLKVFGLICQIYDCGVMYRDVAPRNVLMAPDGETLKIIDFDGCYPLGGTLFQKFRRMLLLKRSLWKRLELPEDRMGETLCQEGASQMARTPEIQMTSYPHWLNLLQTTGNHDPTLDCYQKSIKRTCSLTSLPLKHKRVQCGF